MKRLIAIILVFSSLILMCACQPTPEKPTVKSKAEGELEKAIEAEPTAAVIDATDHISEKFKGKDEKVTIELDADVTYPGNLSSIEVYEAVPCAISAELIQKAVDCCMEGKTPYDPPTAYTKTELDKMIKELEEHLTDEWLNEYYQGDEGAIESSRSEFTRQRDEYLKSYKTAPESFEKKTATIEYKPHKYYMSSEEYKLDEKDWSDGNDKEARELLKNLRSDEPTEFHCMADLDDGNFALISSYEIELSGYYPFYTLQHGISFSKGKRYVRRIYGNNEILWGNKGEDKPVDVTISEEEARKLARELIEALGLSDELCETGCYHNAVKDNGNTTLYVEQGVYVISYRRGTSGLSCYNTDYMRELETQYAFAYGEEAFDIYVTDEGIVHWQYTYPMKKTKTLNEGIGILSFEDVLQRFREQSAVTYDSYVESYIDANEVKEDIYSAETDVRFSSMTLCAIRLKEKNSSGRYIIAPCWVFKGNRTDYDEKYEKISSRLVTLIINGVDGTVVTAADCF